MALDARQAQRNQDELKRSLENPVILETDGRIITKDKTEQFIEDGRVFKLGWLGTMYTLEYKKKDGGGRVSMPLKAAEFHVLKAKNYTPPVQFKIRKPDEPPTYLPNPDDKRGPGRPPKSE